MTSPLGLESGTVVVVPYNAAWPELFKDESARIAAAIAPLTLDIKHTGSTAVPGLAAKPVLDILAGYNDPAQRMRLVRALVTAGYDHRGPQGVPEREFFRRGAPRSYHVHMVITGGIFWREHQTFRDALRADPALRDEYAALKYDLMRRYPTDRETYIESKTPFVRAVLAKHLP